MTTFSQESRSVTMNQYQDSLEVQIVQDESGCFHVYSKAPPIMATGTTQSEAEDNFRIKINEYFREKGEPVSLRFKFS